MFLVVFSALGCCCPTVVPLSPVIVALLVVAEVVVLASGMLIAPAWYRTWSKISLDERVAPAPLLQILEDRVEVQAIPRVA